MDQMWWQADPSCALAALATRPSAVLDAALLHDVILRVNDWELCRRLCTDHGVSVLVYQRFGTLIAQCCPPQIWARWRDGCQALTMECLARSGELVSVVAQLESAHIPVLVVKGPVLGVAFYDGIGLRPFEDLDLVVRSEDLERALTMLSRLGYVPKYALTGALRRGYFRRFGELHLTHATTGTVIDLHWSLLWQRYGFAAALDGAWDRTATVSIGREPIRTLGTEDLLVYLLIHAAKHGWQCLAWLGDIARVILGSAAMDWVRIASTTQRTGSTRLIATGLEICSRLLDAPQQLPASLAGAAEQRLARDVCWRLLHSPQLCSTGPARPLFYRALERRRDRLRWVHEVLLQPTPPDWHVVALPAALDWLYPLVRAARLMRKHSSLVTHKNQADLSHTGSMVTILEINK
ncbi:MAG: nucleotidyltransferase domain-containing protein [Longimicrobiales bacterium]